jgi:hypothetical protein
MIRVVKGQGNAGGGQGPALPGTLVVKGVDDNKELNQGARMASGRWVLSRVNSINRTSYSHTCLDSRPARPRFKLRSPMLVQQSSNPVHGSPQEQQAPYPMVRSPV